MGETASMCMYAYMTSESPEAVRCLIRRMMAARDWSMSRLAKEAGIASTTVTRFMRGATPENTISTTNLMKLSRASGVPILIDAPADPGFTLRVAIGGRLAMARRSKKGGETPEAAATLLGWTVEELLSYETGEVSIPADKLVQFAVRFGVDAGQLLLGTPPQPPTNQGQ